MKNTAKKRKAPREGKAPKVEKTTTKCKNCLRNIQYRDSLSSNVLVVEKSFIHKRCKKENEEARPPTRLEQKHLKLLSEFIQCNKCKMIIDKMNGPMHIFKCLRLEIEMEDIKNKP